MENENKPRLDDPAEWAIVRSMYFDESRPQGHDLDPIERLERMEARERNSNKNSR